MAESPWKRKLGRARGHERDLEAALREYSQFHPFELVSAIEGNDLVVRVHVRHEIPEELSLIVGDLLHNARSALDLLVTSAARNYAFESGRQLSSGEERALSFPITRTESDFGRAERKLKRFLSEETMMRIRLAQPWFTSRVWLAHEDEEVTADKLDMLSWLNLLWRLSLLDNLDKHRDVLALDFQRGTITLADHDIDPIDDGAEPEGRPIDSFDELDPQTRENLIATILAWQEEDERPDSYDFYFSAGELHDGVEIGRYMRHDRGPMPGDLTARGSLRLVLWEPELAARFPGAPPLQKTVREMIDEVEWACNFVETGVLGDGTTLDLSDLGYG
jgi:hypothetical protein